jgi:hypothetical protein
MASECLAGQAPGPAQQKGVSVAQRHVIVAHIAWNDTSMEASHDTVGVVDVVKLGGDSAVRLGGF